VIRALLAAALAALAFSIPGAFGGGVATPGVSADSILLGGTVPLSGPEAAFGVVAAGADAYFKYVNARGGVLRRTIKYEYLDDAYDPGQTVVQTRRLVEENKVFAIFNSVGTEQVLAVRPYLTQQGVPQLFVGSGLTRLGREYKQHPWTIGYLVDFAAEGKVFGSYIAKTKPQARIAVLYEASDYGRELLAGLQRGLNGKAKIVAKETYNVTDPDVSSPIATLRGSNADTLILFALPKQTIQTFVSIDKLGWHPKVFITSVSIDPAVMQIARLNTSKATTEGAMSLAFLKDPTNVRWAKDPGVKLYFQIMKRYAPKADPKAVAHFYGMAAAHTMVDTLRHAGKNLTRQSLMNAATHLNERDNPFLIPGIVVRTTPTFRFPITQVQLYRYQGGLWRPQGSLVSARP
jgi:branched-chain amino acid transport system substrate-binding protein